LGKRIWIEGKEFGEIAKMAEEQGWSEEQFAQYLERRYKRTEK
jgi:ribonuclease PH